MLSLMLIQGIVERGLIFSLVTLSVYISSRIINFDNLSVEGAFGVGGAISAACIAHAYNPWLAFFLAMLGGAVTGIATSVLHTRLKLNHLMSGIVITTGLFSIILKIAGSNLPLYGQQTMLTMQYAIPGFSLIFLSMLIVLVYQSIAWFLTTEVGFLLRALGDNPQMLTNIGKHADWYQHLGLMISNILAAASGALAVQYFGYFSIWASIGVLIIGLASLIIAESIGQSLYLLMIGSIVYQLLISLTFALNLDQDWNKLITALLIILLIAGKQIINQKGTLHVNH